MPTIAGASETFPGKFLDIGGYAHNVKHPNYGAVGDGVANDTAALQAAIDAAAAEGGGIVLLPQGIYGVSADVNVKDGVVLVGVGPGGRRVSAGVTRDAGSCIKWIGGTAPTNAVVVSNIAGASQVNGVQLRDLRIDANGQPKGIAAQGWGSGCAVRSVIVEQFSSRGLDLDRASGAYNTEDIEVRNVGFAGMGGSRPIVLNYVYSSSFSDIVAELALGETTAMARGVDLAQFVVGCSFDRMSLEDCILPVDVGTGAGGTCRGNLFTSPRISNPTIAPSNVTIGAFTGTVGLAIRTNAAENTGNVVVALRDEYGFNRMFYNQTTGFVEAGAAGKTMPLMLDDGKPFVGTVEYADITDSSVVLDALQALAALGTAGQVPKVNAGATGMEFGAVTDERADIRHNGVSVGVRAINLVDTNTVSWTVVEDAAAGEVDASAIAASAFLTDPVSYNTATDSTYATTSTTFVDVDATNVLITFVARGTKALVRATCHALGEASQRFFFNLRDAGGDVAGTSQVIAFNVGAGFRVVAEFYLTGLTDGATYTYKLGFRVTGGTGAIYRGPTYGPIVLTALKV